MPLRKLSTVFFVFLFMISGILLVEQCKPKVSNEPVDNTVNDFVGDKSCQRCHASAYDAWHGSGHFKAMMVANDSTVKGDFNDKIFSADGVTSRFFKKDGKFFINTQSDDGRNHDFEVKYSFGYFPLQQYLVEFPGGRMQATRLSWDVKNKKWFNQYAGQKIPPHDWIHWTGNGQNWNTMCASCHSTNLKKNYDPGSDSYHTSFSVLNVSCESCHGPAKLHINYIESDAYKSGKKMAGSHILLSKNAGQTEQINTCVYCHARRAEISANPLAGPDLLDNFIPEIPTNDHYYADGQAKDEDYNYTSFTESQMFRRGVKCTNCHEPHTAKMLFNGNQLCTQCHAKSFDNPAHTFHTIGSAGAECKNCHMPGKIYMGNDLRYDHTFRVPRPDLSVQYGTPNACNNCHKEKSFQWAATAVNKWWGPVRKYHFAEDLIPGSKTDENSEAHLIKLLNDTVPDIVKAASAFYLGSIQTSNSLQALLQCLRLQDAQIRYRALMSLAQFPTEQWINVVGPLLHDKVRAVRIAAAELFVSIPSNKIPPDFYTDFMNAKGELEAYLVYQTDFSVGNVMLGDYYLKLSDYANAEKFYLRGIQKDSAMNYARLNLSVTYNLSHQNELALKVLQDAAKTDAGNDRIYFNMALLYNEMNNKEAAANSFAKAVALHSTNPKVYYNYGLLLQQQGNIPLAIKTYDVGLRIAPTDPELNYTLALLYLQTGKNELARKPASVLKKYFPDNPDYQKMFQFLKL